MAVWINQATAAFVYDPYNSDIALREVHGSKLESHNSVSGNPIFKVRLECPWEYIENAKARLLGFPERWPFISLLKNIFVVSADIINDNAIGTTDTSREVINYTYNALLDVTYAQRAGSYVEDFNNEHVYWYDRLEHRNEAFTVNYNQLIWGKITDVAPTDKIPVAHHEAPVLYEPGYTLTHTIEGWCRQIPDELKEDAETSSSPARPLIGSVNKHAYDSPNLRKVFAIGTLMLRSIISESVISFRSYRFPVPTGTNFNDPPGSPARFDSSGLPSTTLKLIYEYRKEGWDKFRRTDVDAVPPVVDWYYMRYNKTPYAKFEPFPKADHRIFLHQQ